jgi:maltose-binding protein MalE
MWIISKHLRGWLLPILLLLGLSGCAQATPTPALQETQTPSPAPTRTITPTFTATPVVVSGTVRIWHSWQEAQVPALLRAIAAFQEDYPFVLFDVLYVPEIDLKLAFEQASLEGRAPSVLIAPGEWGVGFYDAGQAIDVSSLLPAELLNSLNPAGVAGARYKDALIGLPVDLRGVVLYRNAAIIPRAPASFDELVSLAQAATQGATLGAVLDRSFFFAGAHLYGLGGELVGSDGAPAFNSDAGLEWVNLLRDFELAGPAEFFGDNDLTAFKEGRVGLIVEGTWRRRSWRRRLVSKTWPSTPGPSTAADRWRGSCSPN